MYPVQIDIGLIGIICLVTVLTLVKLLIIDPRDLDKIPGRKWIRGEDTPAPKMKMEFAGVVDKDGFMSVNLVEVESHA